MKVAFNLVGIDAFLKRNILDLICTWYTYRNITRDTDLALNEKKKNLKAENWCTNNMKEIKNLWIDTLNWNVHNNIELVSRRGKNRAKIHRIDSSFFSILFSTFGCFFLCAILQAAPRFCYIWQRKLSWKIFFLFWICGASASGRVACLCVTRTRRER